MSQRCESEASLVAMDFSGKAGGRVIQNAWEAQSAEREEGQAWRVRITGSDGGVENATGQGYRWVKNRQWAKRVTGGITTSQTVWSY